jgi:hypothetical protein
MTHRTNADFLQVLLREAREDPLVNFVLAECRLVSFETDAPQPVAHVHDVAPARPSSCRPMMSAMGLERQICADRAMSAVPPLATKMLSRSKRAPCGDPRIFSAPVLPGRTGALANITQPPQAAAPRLRCWAIDRLLGEATRAGSRSPQCREGACRFLLREQPQRRRLGR